MRHRHSKKYLGRDTSHRKALMINLADELIMHKSIETTLAKAKFVKPYVEKLVTRAKKGNDFNTVKYLKTKLSTDSAVRELLATVAPKFKERNGGYTRIVKLGNRVGDLAIVSRIEFVN